jgi:hypothetical protein
VFIAKRRANGLCCSTLDKGAYFVDSGKGPPLTRVSGVFGKDDSRQNGEDAENEEHWPGQMGGWAARKADDSVKSTYRDADSGNLAEY